MPAKTIPCDWPTTREEMLALVQKLADEVNGELPDASLDKRLNVAMKRCKGSMNPHYVRRALDVPPGGIGPPAQRRNGDGT